MDEYVNLLKSTWSNICPAYVHISPDKTQMLAKMAENSFDGGRTSSWVASITPIWISVRAKNKNHTVHVVTDRHDVMKDVEKGLSIMAWLTEKPLTWYWWDHPWDRCLPAGIDPGPEHLNGGWAVPGVPEVHVYRREEALKVMIHESIHALLLDVKPALVEPVRNRFETLFGRQLWPHLGECYTELMAELLWSVVQDVPWSSQKQCSRKQAGQVWARIYDATADEKTNVFAYYILKWVLMQHEEVFLGPNHCVTLWYDWFMESLPELEKLRLKYKDSESESISLAMTCVQDF